jgi:pimeloyl-ACP methyl ester carboxylesterase/DNA-binding SARP family transcriptional activator
LGEGTKVQVRLIGPVALLRDGEPLPLPPSRKTRALLAYLAATDAAHRRERLCAMFWDLPDDPRGGLRWSLSKLRAALGDALITDRETVRIDTGACRVDLLDLQRGETGDWDPADPILAAEFCEGLDLPRCDDFQVWCVATREDVRQLQLKALRKRVAEAGQPADRRLDMARRVVELDPLCETARHGLIRLLIEAGRTGEAEAQRQQAIQSLQDAGIRVPVQLARPVEQKRNALEPSAAPQRQRVQFCTANDGTGIAYSCIGDGPPLVKTANWLNHLEFEWESPIWRHWLRELSRDRMLVRYDERGNGLSDWKVKDISFEAFVSDLETVTDTIGLNQFDLLCISQGCAIGIAYAVRHPERVRRLILVGGFAAGWRVRANAEEIARREAMLALTGTGWGRDNPAFRQMFTTLFFPGATAEEADWFNELQRVSTSPEGAQRLQVAFSLFDVRDLLTQVRAPTLVFHARDDAVIPFESGRYIAARIPGAEFVALDSANHLILEHEPAWAAFVERLYAFLP